MDQRGYGEPGARMVLICGLLPKQEEATDNITTGAAAAAALS